MSKPSVCLLYVFNETELPLLRLSLEVMLKHPWVSTAVGLETTGAPVDLPGISITSADYGRGAAVAPELGGFRQVHARNRALALAEAQRCDWLLLCDADEFFTEDAWGPLQQAHETGATSCWYDCYHFCKHDEYHWDPQDLHQVMPYERQLAVDPHPRGLRASENYRFEFNRNLAADQGDNPHRHCVVNCDMFRIRVVAGLCHVHVKHWLKAPPQDKPRKAAPVGIMPAPYLAYAARVDLLNV